MNRAIRFHSTGDPTTSLVLDTVSSPEPGPGQVTVKIHYTPVHPADLNTIIGNYGKQPDLPAVPGSEAFGKISAVGSGVAATHDLSPGTPVILRHRGSSGNSGTWQDHLTVEAASVTPCPSSLDPQQASMLKINPVTAWLLLHSDGGKTDSALPHSPETDKTSPWVVQNAANSAVGTTLIQIAKSLGIHTLNAVRSESAAQACRDAGAEHVIVDGDDFTSRALEITGGARPALACNAVGGPAAIHLMDFLAESGTMVTYGAMSRQALKVPNSFLIFKNLTLNGLWVTKWIDSAPAAEWTALIEKLAAQMIAGHLKIPIAKTYPADQFKTAVEHATQDQRNGKILLDFTPSP